MLGGVLVGGAQQFFDPVVAAEFLGVVLTDVLIGTGEGGHEGEEVLAMGGPLGLAGLVVGDLFDGEGGGVVSLMSRGHLI